MGYCVICLILLFTAAAKGYSILPIHHNNDVAEVKLNGERIVEYTDVNEPHERERRMTQMFKKPPPKNLSSSELFCKFMKNWLSTFKFGFSFTSRPFKSLF